MSDIRFTHYPKTEPAPPFTDGVVELFRKNEQKIGTRTNDEAWNSDEVLAALSDGLAGLGFQVENGKARSGKILRPVFFGENGQPTVQYQVDAYQPEWKCGLEIEAGRAWMGNAVYRDLVQAMLMVNLTHLCLAVPNEYRYRSGGRPVVSKDYQHATALAEALYGHSRVRLPYSLLLIGY